MCELIKKSKNPIIIAGQGGIKSSSLIRSLSKKCNIPVTTTIHGMGIVDDTDKLSLGMLGMHGNAAANFAVQDADLILAIGYRFCDRTTGNLKDYAIKAKQAGLVELGGIVHFNIDDSEFNRVVNSDININGDCYHNLNFILKKIEKMEKIEWINKIIKLKKFKFSYNLDYKDQIKTQNVIEEIYNFTKSRRML